MKIELDNKTYKRRNSGKIATLVGTDQIYKSILDFDMLVDNNKITIKDLVEKVYTGRYELDANIKELNAKLDEANNTMAELKKALKEYIEKENKVDIAITASIELMSNQINNINDNLNELNSKCKYL